jgi:phosphotransferase system enzyme I (PtsP)
VPTTKGVRSIAGHAASDGIAVGALLRVGADAGDEDDRPPRAADQLTHADYLRARDATAAQLADFQRRIEARIEEPVSALFRAHLAMLTDPELAARIERGIAAGAGVVNAIEEGFDHYIRAFSASASQSVREKARDLHDLRQRMIANLNGVDQPSAELGGRILIAVELLPSELLRYVAEGVTGVILTGGGVTAHIGMLARSLTLPMVLAEAEAVATLPDGQQVLLDATQGAIILEPDAALTATYAPLLHRGPPPPSGPLPDLVEARTRDGVRIELQVNIGLLAELPTARAVGAEGIGLYRSEIPFLVRDDLPSEEEQFGIYRRILEGMDSRPVVFRTLDIGGDKVLSYFPQGEQANPSLGLRGIRFSLSHQEVFRAQLRALLRAGAGHRLQILFPLVSSLDAFAIITQIVASCISGLVAAGMPCNQQPELGVMIELPSAVGVVEELAAACAFLSIGTNDLVQHILAVDRTNRAVAAWYIPWHPAVLRAIKRVAVAAAQASTPLSVCGDMAYDHALLPVLIGMGITRFSIPPFAMARVRQTVQELDTTIARELSERALRSGRILEICDMLGKPRPQITG